MVESLTVREKEVEVLRLKQLPRETVDAFNLFTPEPSTSSLSGNFDVAESSPT